MREVKKEKLGEIIHRLAAEFVQKESTKASLLTITRVVVSDNGKVAKIFFTTIPESQEETAEKFLGRKSGEFKQYLRDHSKIGFPPMCRFHIDLGERNRQRLDELSEEIK